MNLVRRRSAYSRAHIRIRPKGIDCAQHSAAQALLADEIRLLVDAACAARLGAAQMSLDDWRDVEQEVKQRLLSKSVNHH